MTKRLFKQAISTPPPVSIIAGEERVPQSRYRKLAFTLAEVLITLGIIGVVAAMTMPVLIGNYQKKQTSARVKKAYATLAEAVKRSELDNDVVDNWNYSMPTTQFYNTYLKNYLTFIDMNQNNKIVSYPDYKKLNGQSASDLYTLSSQSFCGQLADGTLVFICYYQNTNYKLVAVDINGLKKPNVLGKDVFYFSIQPKYGVTPFGFGTSGTGTSEGFGYEYKKEVITGSHKSACSKTGYGSWCTALLYLNNWEFTKDYPW